MSFRLPYETKFQKDINDVLNAFAPYGGGSFSLPKKPKAKRRAPIHTFRHNEKSGTVTGSNQKIPCPLLLLFACERAENLPLCAALKPTYPISFLDQNPLHDLIRLTNPAAPKFEAYFRKVPQNSEYLLHVLSQDFLAAQHLFRRRGEGVGK